jgi:toluene monooxygenase system ferredoxin subunit
VSATAGSGTWVRVASLDDLWEGEVMAVDANGHHILLAHLEGGVVRAYQGICPHQEIKLVEGEFDGRTLVCRGHRWEFDLTCGAGVNPADCALAEYPVLVEGEEIYVSTEGVSPRFSY